MFTTAEQPVYEFVRQHYRTYRELPQPETVRVETGVALPTRINEPLAYYVDQVYIRHEYTQIRESFGGLREAVSAMDMESARTHISAMHRSTRMGQRRGREVTRLDDAMNQVLARLDATKGMGGITGIETGWHDYDFMTGGYQDGDLISLVGRPQLGKTYILLKQAFAAHDAGENVLFVTTEMSTEQIARRGASLKLGINPRVLKMNTISTHVERRLRQYVTDMVGMERFNVFSVGMNSKVAAIEALVQEYQPTIVCIDGVYLLRPSEGPKNMNRTERITGVFDEVKGLCLDAALPIVVTTQFNRQAGKGGKDGSLENIGYSDAIGTHSSIVVGLKHGPTENPSESRIMEFLKGREGETGEFAINFKFAPLNMEAISLAERQQAAEEEGSSLDWMQ